MQVGANNSCIDELGAIVNVSEGGLTGSEMVGDRPDGGFDA